MTTALALANRHKCIFCGLSHEFCCDSPLQCKRAQYHEALEHHERYATFVEPVGGNWE